MNYPATFLEREAVLRVLYENLKDKSKIRLEKKITKVDHNSEEVIVFCEDGTAIGGDVLVGCDGVNSKVRQELWRVSDYQEPGAFDPNDKDMLFAEYKCLFGLSTETKGIHSGDINVTNTRGTSTMVIGGRGKVLWCKLISQPYWCIRKDGQGLPRAEHPTIYSTGRRGFRRSSSRHYRYASGKVWRDMGKHNNSHPRCDRRSAVEALVLGTHCLRWG
jgi:hypothetical protein